VSVNYDKEQEEPFTPQGEASGSPDEEPEDDDDGRGKSLEALLWRQSRKSVMETYRRYAENPAQHEEELYQTVLNFAFAKLYPLEIEFKSTGTTDTCDDHAQEVVIKVWQDIGRPWVRRNGASGPRTPTEFYNWLNRQCFTKSKDAGRALRRAVNEKVPLFTSFDEDGVPEENPLLNKFSNAIDLDFNIPEWVVGTDRCICQLMLDGRDYAQIAKELGMSLAAVEKRMSRLRQEVKDRKINPALCQDSARENRLFLRTAASLTDKSGAKKKSARQRAAAG